MRNTYILTVPHHTCGSRDRGGHPCDTAAAAAAYSLQRALWNLGETVVGPLLGSVPRTTSDLNRFESRPHEWRQDLDSSIMAAGTSAVVVDVHSFDRGAQWEVDATLGGRRRPLIVFLDSVAGGDISRDFIPELPPEFAEVASASGSPANDIVLRADELGARAILVEIDEENAANPQWLASASAAVVAALRAVYGGGK